MSAFKAGDRVRVRKLGTYKTGAVGFVNSMDKTIGQVGEVESVRPRYVAVRFGDPVNDCWNYDFDWIEKVIDFAPVLAEYEPVQFENGKLMIPIETPEQLRATLDKLGVAKKDAIREEFLKLGWAADGEAALRKAWSVIRSVSGRWQWLSGTGIIDSVEKARAVDTMVTT